MSSSDSSGSGSTQFQVADKVTLVTRAPVSEAT
jgi:hypothetical protein